jgi:hypothetical protein
MLGFASAIRKERAWRIKRGESLANLQAFARLADARRVRHPAPRPGLTPRPVKVLLRGSAKAGSLGSLVATT